jgi:hypothetical protein
LGSRNASALFQDIVWRGKFHFSPYVYPRAFISTSQDQMLKISGVPENGPEEW